ncbi:MAMMARY TURMOR VIRUS RECEPTOR-like protein 1 2 MTVR1 2 [Salix purpurea]|uniref:MAMMARY TURMOR VIRUS RECEPTOR-like protein 1 2 MTVR1 2 n=1 Tax=Salix purpurea TaxID=77065 RepID=A0A9Q0U9Z8_SALPP|nr:MAMMARY TURMOR VIRUS RECEPTOR-like protein 1 2 MTVR1 2 [Salix purpurea]
MCFERAGDERGEKLSKAAGLKAAADRMHSSNPEMASVARRQAAEIFESIGKAEYAAECFYMLKEYDRAGKIYLQCGESAMERAGECFFLAGSYCSAAEVYAKGCHFSKCLSACTNGKLFDTGLHYIQYWKQHGTADQRCREMDTIEQEFLESCACHYYELNDRRAMMRYVRDFDSMSSVRTLLNNLGCLDELLLLEVESGNFLEAAGIAKQKGELVHEADLLGKGGHFKEASLLILWFVFANSLWSTGSKGWPLKQFSSERGTFNKSKVTCKGCMLSGLRDIPRKFIRREGSLVSVDVHQFVSAAQSYWRLELLSVGMNVLTNLEALYNLSVRNSLSLFCQSRSLVHIYEVAKFLLNCQFLSSQHNDIKALRKFTRLATESFYDCIYPRDWRESLKENMISLRRNGICRNLLKEVIFENVSSKNKLSYAQLGRITLMILGSGEMLCEPYEKKADGLEWNSSWKAFIEDLCRNVNEESYMQKLHEALVDTYNANWRIRDYILPGCFLYMLERQLILLSYFQGNFLTTKSSFVEWLIYQEGHGSPSFESLMGNAPPSLARNLTFIVDVVQHFLYNDKDMMDWIRVTENVKVMKDYHAVVVLRLVVIICLVYLNFGWCADLLSNLLGRINITKQLPRQFYDAIQKRRKYNFLNLNLNVVAEAFSKIDNPLVVVSLGKNCSRFLCPDAIFVDMKVSESKDNVLRILFPKTDATAQVHTGAIEANTRSSFKRIVSQGIEDPGKIPELPSNVGDVANWNSRCGKKDEDKPPLRHDRLWEICEALKFQNHGIDERTNIACDPTFKVDINRITCLLKAAIDGCFQNNPPSGDKKNLLEEASIMLDEMRQLNAALEMREPELESDFSTIGELLEKLLSRRPRMELFLNQIFLQQDENPKREMAETSTAPDGRHGEEYGNSKAEGSSNSAEGERNVSESNVETGGSNPDMENKGKEGKQQVQEK